MQLAVGTVLVLLSLGLDRFGLGTADGFGRSQAFLLLLGLGACLLAVFRPQAIEVGSGRGTRATGSDRTIGPAPTGRPARGTVGPADIVVLGVWAALATGFLEVLYMAGRKLLFGKAMGLDQHFVWLTPAGYLALFVALGIVLALALRSWRRIPPPVPTGAFALASAFSLFLLPPLGQRLELYARVVLAAGVAVAVARGVRDREERVRLGVRRSVGWMLAALPLLAAVSFGYQIGRERLAILGLPEPPRGTKNVLLLILDTVRAKELSLYGYARPTSPNLMALAGGGVTFDRAFSTSSWTLPSHASIFTGREPSELSADWEAPLDGEFPTLAEYFRSHGYLASGFVGNTIYGSWEFGLDRGFIHYEDHDLSGEQLIRSTVLGSWLLNSEGVIGEALDRRDLLARKRADAINRSFLDWLDDRGDRPFFAFINYFDAHDPYLPPDPFRTRFGPEGARPNYTLDWGWKWTREQIAEEERAYDGAIAYLDHEIGRLRDALAERGLLESTVVIVTADHGEHFGEFGLMNHGSSLYPPVLHVPLIVWSRGEVPAGLRIAEPVSLRNLASTIVDLAGIAAPIPFPGRSLARFWRAAPGSGASAGRALYAEVRKGVRTPARYPVSRGDLRTLIEGPYQYILNGDGREELIEYEAGPGGDLARDSSAAGVLAALRQAMQARLADRRKGTPGLAGTPVPAGRTTDRGPGGDPTATVTGARGAARTPTDRGEPRGLARPCPSAPAGRLTSRSASSPGCAPTAGG